MPDLDQHTVAAFSKAIRKKALSLGFDAVGFAKAELLQHDQARLERWLSLGHQGEMGYMEKNTAKRVDPRKLLAGTSSVISLLMNYYPSERQQPDSYHIAKYAYGEDYHRYIKNRLQALEVFIRETTGSTVLRSFVDSAPVLEKSWAVKSGLGWVGKHCLLINKQLGSYCYLSEVLLDVALDYDQPFTADPCGNCNLCVAACPSSALNGDRTLNANKCISYVNKRKQDLPAPMKDQLHDWIYGCDICQDACPWNAAMQPTTQANLQPHPALHKLTKKDFEEMTREQFEEIFRHTAIPYDLVKRNIEAVK